MGELKRRKGPAIVALGGGHGLSAILRGLKLYTDDLTAIVTVADDGGGSGRHLRLLRPSGGPDERGIGDQRAHPARDQ